MSRGSRGLAWWAPLLVLGLLAAPGVVYADDTSTHALPLLRMGAGTRALGMGGAQVAAGRDANVGYYNPAGLAWMPGTQISAMYALGMDEDRRMSFVTAAHQFEWGALGASFVTAGMQDVPGYDSDNNPTGTFDYGDLALMAHGAYLYQGVSVGATLKFIHQGVGDAVVAGEDDANGWGFDLGATARPWEWLSFGVSLRDLASEVGSDDEANNVPMDFRFGTAFMPLYGATFAFDIDHVQDESDFDFHAGGEYAFDVSPDVGAALRLGLNDGNFTAGLGVGVSIVEFDYAFVDEPEDFLGQSHRVGVTLRFGEPMAQRAEGYQGAPSMKDTDLDGIPDSQDACPGAAEDFDGFEDTDGCPDLDNDGDGIYDANDDCPNLPEDFDGFQDDDGCPDVDNDGDGIPDINDKCPNAPETVNNYEDFDGCPDGMPEHLRVANILFKYDSDQFTGADPIPVLEDILAMMKKNPEMKVEIVGYTDSRGSDAYNEALSERRAGAIKAWFVERGVDAARLTAVGRGEQDPIAPNDTEAGMARNRRIEFNIIP